MPQFQINLQCCGFCSFSYILGVLFKLGLHLGSLNSDNILAVYGYLGNGRDKPDSVFFAQTDTYFLKQWNFNICCSRWSKSNVIGMLDGRNPM